MAAVQVVNAVSNVAWTTDKVQFTTGAANVTFQVSQTQTVWIQANGVPANTSMSTGNIYANAIVVPANSNQEFYVGVGNYLNILTGSGFSAVALGTQSSGTSGVYGSTSGVIN
jgi:hypothetical protein